MNNSPADSIPRDGNPYDDSRQSVLDYYHTYKNLTPEEILEIMGSMYHFVVDHMTDEAYSRFLRLREEFSVPGSGALVRKAVADRRDQRVA